ncbi:GNAT family N-acetyltransferase [Algoriphagus sp. AK58]|uniref:GNAT family N-acetyltransferase n=1 Tax=Algoriphagus sp. AK58 TaxID=1406877 RepID=UPI001650BD24|nr:GNAT family N-acetyltransferase [Algoriphagus sp. AK58]MBC6365263.1 hypothetical protein [Algoriphagus sp. AK58]
MHLVLTPPHQNDLIEFHKMNQDLMIQREFSNLKNITLDGSKQLLKNIIMNFEENPNSDFCFIKLAFNLNDQDYYDNSNSVLVGFISVNEGSFTEFNFSGFQTLLTYGIIERFRNKGLMTNALNFRIERFEELGFNIIPAYIKGNNPASEKVLIKCGFIKILENDFGCTYVKRITMPKVQFDINFKEI